MAYEVGKVHQHILLGLVVMGEDSCSIGCGFEFQQRIRKVIFYVNMLLKLSTEKTQVKEKRP